MSESSARSLVSEAEFLRLPESVDRIELIDGEVIVSPSPSYWHQEILGRILVALRGWAAGQPGPVVIGQSPLDVRFAPGRILQPDAFVILGHAIARDHEGPIDRVPDLCVEVLSTDRAYDGSPSDLSMPRPACASTGSSSRRG
jgi:Uma2 family endonuclease